MPDLRERFVTIAGSPPDSEDCWPWPGYIHPSGYGIIYSGRETEAGHALPAYAHRVSYELFVAPIPSALQIDHLCRNRACVNPRHLDPVTGAENMRRAFADTCRKGHQRTPENTYRDPGGYARCRDCRRERENENRAASS